MSQQMVRVLTHEAGPQALSWAVFSALGFKSSYPYVLEGGWRTFDPVRSWEDAKALISGERISFVALHEQAGEERYGAVRLGGCGKTTISRGPTLLIAAVRCWLTNRVGQVISVPVHLAWDDQAFDPLFSGHQPPEVNLCAELDAAQA